MLLRVAVILMWFRELLPGLLSVPVVPSSSSSSSSSSLSGMNFENYSHAPGFAVKSRILRSIDKSVLLVNETKVLNRNSINTAFERTRPASGGSRRMREVSILGLFELSTRHGVRKEGYSELAAAQLAVQHINRRGLLLGYTLKLLTNDTKCDPGVGIDRFFHALYTYQEKRIIMVLGSACSEVTESLAKIVPYWNIVQVSFGSTSPALSDRSEFPLFYRTVAPDSSHNLARIAFIKYFGWDTVATFSENEEGHSLAINDLVTELERANITCAATISFAETDFKEQLKLLRDKDIRVIIGSFSHEIAAKVFCEVYQLGMFGADYAWILQDTEVISYWWLMQDVSCPLSSMLKVVQNVVLVSSYNGIVGTGTALSGLTNDLFLRKLLDMNATGPVSRFAPQTYDAVWAMALALRGAERTWTQVPRSNRTRLAHYDYTRFDIAKELLRQFDSLQFNGISGPVSFNGADRVGTTSFHQIQTGGLRLVAFYYPKNNTLDFSCRKCGSVQWESGQVPIAKRILKLRVDSIAPLAFYTVVILSTVGIAMSFLFLGLNLRFRKLRAIKLSSPKLSTITVCGCILVYVATILLGMNHATLSWPSVSFSTICMARIYFLSAGFSLAFGSMFAKTFRVYRLFTLSAGGLCKDKILRDTQLISMIGVLLLLDACVVSFWMTADPMERYLHNLTLEISTTDRSLVFLPQVELCRSRHYESWLGTLYAYKGLLLIVGVYMAWQTRHVKIPALNDSQYIGVSVYSVVITSATVVLLTNLLYERVTLAFVITSAFILVSTTATLCLLFLPKVKGIFGKGEVYDPVIHSVGLKLECNTRRFVVDDRRELQFRVEVQNRVYRKEIEVLDAEIKRLERLLVEGSSLASSGSSETTIKPYEGQESATAVSPKIPTASSALPMLLLSVLPPVIPRASWPTEDFMPSPMKRNFAFSSQPQIDSDEQQDENKGGIIDRIRCFLGSRMHKTTSVSVLGGASAAVRRPSVLTIFAEVDAENETPVAVDQNGAEVYVSQNLRSAGSEPRVNFLLDVSRRSSITGQKTPPTLRERIKGSPRFPHRVCPVANMTKLGDRAKLSFLTVKSCDVLERKNDDWKTNWKSADQFSKSVGQC
ncbi:gamma-aminobutyric acid type B receptor subunit 2 [Malaya genurostris]|uniref:gamma-aminobutyric acid type B receptor subunit 2 n=1 Tax=Malaya genurostris TaxID=325434 RepID=UPI0026F3FF3D|nr:gamma-aminobutyric acid type B receptor subunit 2 [Malaya genurostris]XP_058454035.1 gamma-aminobutyric acid type B receptor subunit 2 [Malaya genurostris]XP_058454036.1 gamma-aminobutyric acid type B receptor subunit 2 [Malaya genurostris]XP_058454037.1 gamma-aminobutyric acid type B receptor subunit 2 [Malaya genurostris]XP_058454038.1 gamma-aminobutyric acid type B receptor subunit 2 [Malaya genurostris]XP_058454040.1 gamma-aminobutyric acid type B receptor subunit 2 [Malaya genurostris]